MWKLGKDMHPKDNILDGITFDDLITAVYCNCNEVNEFTVTNTAKEILKERSEDYMFLLKNNVHEIIDEVLLQRMSRKGARYGYMD